MLRRLRVRERRVRISGAAVRRLREHLTGLEPVVIDIMEAEEAHPGAFPQRFDRHTALGQPVGVDHDRGRSWMIDQDTPNRSRSMLKRVA